MVLVIFILFKLENHNIYIHNQIILKLMNTYIVL